jgi:outer membrane protein TolC
MYKPITMSKELIIKYLKLLILGYVFIIFPFNLHSQIVDSNRLIDPISTDIVNIIPPLSVLIDSALNTPSMKSLEASLAVRKIAILTSKRNILKNLSFQTYYNYGNTDVYSLSNSSSSINTLLNTASQSTTSYYGVGTSLRFSIFDFLEYKNSIKVEKINYEQVYYEKEKEKLQIRKQIITQYYNLILLQKKLKMSHQSFIDAQTQAVMAEKEFAQGEMGLSEVAIFRDMKIKNQIQLDASWCDFMIAYTLLQDLTGIRFINLKNIE